jgi:hypothetical protein
MSVRNCFIRGSVVRYVHVSLAGAGKPGSLGNAGAKAGWQGAVACCPKAPMRHAGASTLPSAGAQPALTLPSAGSHAGPTPTLSPRSYPPVASTWRSCMTRRGARPREDEPAMGETSTGRAAPG